MTSRVPRRSASHPQPKVVSSIVGFIPRPIVTGRSVACPEAARQELMRRIPVRSSLLRLESCRARRRVSLRACRCAPALERITRHIGPRASSLPQASRCLSGSACARGRSRPRGPPTLPGTGRGRARPGSRDRPCRECGAAGTCGGPASRPRAGWQAARGVPPISYSVGVVAEVRRKIGSRPPPRRPPPPCRTRQRRAIVRPRHRRRGRRREPASRGDGARSRDAETCFDLRRSPRRG